MATNDKDVGATLRAARERRGLTLQQIAKATRISVHSLEAIERNDIARLPGGIFSRGFVRGYAHQVGLDAEEVVRDFLEQFPVDAVTYGSPLVDLPPHGAERHLDPDLKPWPNLVLVGAVLAVGVVGVALAVMWARGALTASASADAPMPVTPPTPAVAPSRPVADSAPPVAQAPRAPAPVMTTPDAPRVSIVSDDPCWVRVITDGRVRFEGLLQPGVPQAGEFEKSAVLTLGDAGRCRVSLNGQATRPLGGPGQVVTLRLTPENVGGFIAR